MCYEMRRRAEACVLVFITAVPIVVVCVFITAVPITKLFACHGPGGERVYQAKGERDRESS